MGINGKLDKIGEDVASLKTSIAYINDTIHRLEKEIQYLRRNPYYFKVLIVVNTILTSWLSALTYIFLKGYFSFFFLAK